MVKLDLTSFEKGNVSCNKIFKSYANKVKKIGTKINDFNVTGKEMLGWVNYGKDYDKTEIKQLNDLAKKWNENDAIKNIVMLGIGGSYIGIRAGIDLVLNEFNRNKNIYYVSSLSSSYVANLLEKLKKEDFYLIVISKSGTTLEVGVAFRLFYDLLFQKLGSEAANSHTVIITDKAKGTLRKIVDNHKLKAFSIPNDVGGRFSAITPVGLFPMAVMGLNVNQVLKGAYQAILDTQTVDINKNTAYQYAVLRDYMYTKKQKTVEVFCVYENALKYFSEHLKQLFAESEGKNHLGLLPYNCLFTTDLHSVGQYLQEGTPIFFETCLNFIQPLKNVNLVPFFNNEDNLDFVNKFNLDQINKIAASSTIDAHHIDGGVDIIKINCDKRDEFTFGYLYIWFAKVVTMSGLLLNINPFNQPGVEAYKKRMFTKLKK